MGKREQDRARQFFRDVRKGALDAVYLFHGEERYLVDEAAREVQQRIFGREEPDPFRLEVLRGGEATGRDIADAARTMSMVGGERLVVVRDAERLGDGDVELLAEYAAKPARSAHLVLVASVKVDGRKRGWKRLTKAATAVLFEPLYSNQMGEWIARQGKRSGMVLSRAAADYLAEALGTDMQLINRALQKLALRVEGGGGVDVELVKQVVAPTRERTVFELTDALSARDLEASLVALGGLFEQGEEPVKVGFMIARHIRILLRIRALRRQQLSDKELASEVKVAPYFLKGYRQAASRFSGRELLALHRLAYETDRKLKSSRQSPEMLLEALVFAACVRAPV